MRKHVFKALVLIGFFLTQNIYSQSEHKHFVSFLKGQNQFQYFIKPITFKNNSRKEKLLIDFTLPLKSNATTNISILSNQKQKDIDSLSFENKNSKLLLLNGAPLFFDKERNTITSRYSFKVQKQLLPSLFQNEEWEISLYSKDRVTVYHPNRKSRKIINAVYKDLFLFHLSN